MMSNKEIIEKINYLAGIHDGLKNKELYVQNEYGILAFANFSKSSELWWLESGKCVMVPKTHKLAVKKTYRMDIYDIEV